MTNFATYGVVEDFRDQILIVPVKEYLASKGHNFEVRKLNKSTRFDKMYKIGSVDRVPLGNLMKTVGLGLPNITII
jgi:hypothetical protein